MNTRKQAGDAIAVENDWSSGAERRRHERYVVNFYIRAVDHATKKSLGDLDDISLSGMKVTRTEPVAPNVVFQCMLEAALESGKRIRVPLVCRSVWCRRQEFGHKYDAGFEFIDASRQLEARILEIIAELASPSLPR